MTVGRILVLRCIIGLALVCGCFTCGWQLFWTTSEESQQRPLRLAIDRSPLQLCPADATTVLSVGVCSLLYEGLYRLDAEGRAVPALVARASCSQDRCCWTFELHQGFWADGQPLRAEDFVASIFNSRAGDNWRAGAQCLGALDWAHERGEGDPVRALDNRTLLVRWSAPCLRPAVELARTAFLPWRTAPAGNLPISNGPYQVVVAQPGGTLQLTPNLHFRLGAPSRDVECIPLDAKSAWAAARKGEMDWIGSPLGARMQLLRASPFGPWTRARAGGLLWLRANTRQPPLQQTSFRAAMREALSASPLWSQEQWQWVRHLGATGQIVSFPTEKKSPQPTACPRKLELMIVADPERQMQAVRVQEALAQAELPVVICPTESKLFFERMKRADFDLALSTWTADSAAEEEMLFPWSSVDHPGNRTGWGSMELASALQQWREQGNRGALSRAIQLVEAGCPVMPLMQLQWVYWKSPAMDQWGISPLGTFVWEPTSVAFAAY